MQSEPKTEKPDTFFPENGKECRCKGHKLQDTGAVFFQSLGFLYCANCGGWQKIKHELL